MDMGAHKTWSLTLVAAAIAYFIPLHWGWRVGIFAFLCWLILAEPILRLMIAEIGAVEITEEDVILALRLDTWQTVLEIRKSIKKNQGVKASLAQVMLISYDLAQRGVIEGRERIPRRSAFFGAGNMFEYRQKPVASKKS